MMNGWTPKPAVMTAIAAWALALALSIPTPAVAQQACPAPPPAVRDISAERFYTDTASSRVDAAAVERNKASLAALDATLQPAIRMADRGLQGDASATACSVRWFVSLAEGRAMLGRMASRQADYERKWRVCGMAIAYLKVRPSAAASARAVIEPWLDALAEAVVADEAKSKDKNNHLYWSGLCAAAAGNATGTSRHLAFARSAFERALTDIAGDGTLPRELARRSRALHYHHWALAPLVLMAEMAALRGENWYDLGGGALHRLAARTLSGLTDPNAFAALADGLKQEVPAGGAIGWLAFYRGRFPERVPNGSPSGTFFYSWYGGSTSLAATQWIKQAPR